MFKRFKRFKKWIIGFFIGSAVLAGGYVILPNENLECFAKTSDNIFSNIPKEKWAEEIIFGGVVSEQAILDPTIALGGITGGSYSDTLTSNDTRLLIGDTAGAPANKYKLDLSFDGTSGTDQWDNYSLINQNTIESIEITLEATDSASTDDYYIMLWNFDTPAWNEIGAVMSIGAEDTFTRNVVSDFASYLNDSNEIKIRIANGKALGKGGAPNNNGVFEIDYLKVTITSQNPPALHDIKIKGGTIKIKAGKLIIK